MWIMEHHSVQPFGKERVEKQQQNYQNMDGHLNWQAMSNSVKLTVYLYTAKGTTAQVILVKYD